MKLIRRAGRRLAGLAKTHKTTSIIVGIVLIMVALGVLSLILETGAKAVVGSKFPEVIKIYDAEQKLYPQYTIGAVKNFSTFYSSEGEKTRQVTYIITLQSRTQMPTNDEIKKAGKAACNTGLPSGTYVTVVGHRQFYIFPFYMKHTVRGTCP